VADRVYLDHAATTPMRPSAIAAMTEQLARLGNPSSLHTSGRQARRIVEESRERIAGALGARPAEVIFTSGGTEADNLALVGTMGARPERPELVISAIEHPAVSETAAALHDRGVCTTTRATVDSTGVVDLDALRVLVGPRTALVSVMWANNEVGTVQPVRDVAAVAHQHGAWVHADAVQAVGHLPVRFADDLDLITLSAHKVGGPVGVGVLLARREITLTAVGHGGGQERDVRSGTVPVALVAGFAAAVDDAVVELAGEAVRLRTLRDRLVQEILAGVDGTTLNGTLDPERSLPTIVNVEFAGCEADALLMLLDRVGIDTSTGSACTAGVSQPSEVLMAMGRSREQAGSALRFSLGRSTTEEDVDTVLRELPAAVASARAAAGLAR